MIKFKKLHPDAIIPKRAKEGDAGFDLYAAESATIFIGNRELIDTGVSVAIPDGYVGIIKPRSGLAVDCGMDILAGVIDSGYRGPLKVLAISHGSSILIDEGDRIAQMVVVPYMGDSVEVDDLDDTDRGDGGFGSSGR